MIELLYIFILLLLMFLVNKKFQLNNLINPFIYFFWTHIVFFYIGIMYADIYQYSGIFINSTTKVYIIYSLIFFVIGGFLSKILMQMLHYPYIKINDIKIPHNTFSDRIYIKTVLPFFIVGILIVIYYSYSIGGYIWFQGNFENIRIETRKGIGSLIIISLNFLTYSGLVLLLSKKINISSLFFFIIITSSLLAFGNRAPFLFFLLILLILKSIQHNIKFTMKHFIIFGGMIFIMMVLFGAIRKGPDELYNLFFHRLPWRPYVNIQNFQILLDNFPSQIDHLYGKGYIIDLSTLLPGYQPNLGTWIKEILGMTFEGGSLTLTYLGVSYINFGLIGLFIYPVIYGFILNTLYMLFVNKSNISVIKLIFIFLISFSLGGSVSTGLIPVILYISLPVIITYFLHRVLITIYLYIIQIYTTRNQNK